MKTIKLHNGDDLVIPIREDTVGYLHEDCLLCTSSAAIETVVDCSAIGCGSCFFSLHTLQKAGLMAEEKTTKEAKCLND